MEHTKEYEFAKPEEVVQAIEQIIDFWGKPNYDLKDSIELTKEVFERMQYPQNIIQKLILLWKPTGFGLEASIELTKEAFRRIQYQQNVAQLIENLGRFWDATNLSLNDSIKLTEEAFKEVQRRQIERKRKDLTSLNADLRVALAKAAEASGIVNRLKLQIDQIENELKEVEEG